MADNYPIEGIPNVPAPKKEEPVKQTSIPIPAQPTPPQIIPLLGLMRMDLPLVRDAHPLAIMTPAGVIPINKVMVDTMVMQLKKLDIESNEVDYIL